MAENYLWYDIKPNYFKKEMTLNDMVVQLQLHLDQTKKHIADLESGTKASAPKCRAELQKIKVLAHQLRKECITTQKTIPVKHRTKVAPAVESPAVIDEIVCMLPAVAAEPVEEIKPKPAKKPRKSKKNEIKEADQH